MEHQHVLLHCDQHSVWDSRSNRVEPELHEDNQQIENYSKREKSTWNQYCPCCSESFLMGTLMGMLIAGIVLAVILVLYFNRNVSNVTCTTVTTIIPLTTTTSITTTSTTTASSSTTTTSTTTVTSTTTSATTTEALNVNLVTNGNGESGLCAMNTAITSPTGWSFSGPITQVSYNNNNMGDQTPSSPGPSDRGNCYFWGAECATTSMWQTISLNDKVDPLHIDNQTIRYNFSAWLGGLGNQDDSASLSLTFIDSNNQLLDSIELGPVLSSDRSSQTLLRYRQINGLVPAGTRSMMLMVTMNRAAGTRNNAAIDNIAVTLY